jgi:ATP-dependent DNA ligase
MLSKAEDTVPTAFALAGGTIWEPKWDGYRSILQVADGVVTLRSRKGTNLTAAFPDVIEAAASQVPPGVVLDGESVVWVDGRLNFDYLQHRMASRPPAVMRLAREHPASYIAFDILAVEGTDVRGLPWGDRRALLDELATGFEPPIQVSPYTDNYETAVEWFSALSPTGVEGLVAKGSATRYRPGERGAWVKVKHRSHVDGIVGAVIGPMATPEAIVIGRYTPEGVLRIVGRSTALSSQQSKELAAVLNEVPASAHPWPTEIGGGHFGGGRVAITHVVPDLVVEAAADTALQAGRHRHALRLIRLRADLAPEDIELA